MKKISISKSNIELVMREKDRELRNQQQLLNLIWFVSFYVLNCSRKYNNFIGLISINWLIFSTIQNVSNVHHFGHYVCVTTLTNSSRIRFLFHNFCFLMKQDFLDSCGEGKKKKKNFWVTMFMMMIIWFEERKKKKLVDTAFDIRLQVWLSIFFFENREFFCCFQKKKTKWKS